MTLRTASNPTNPTTQPLPNLHATQGLQRLGATQPLPNYPTVTQPLTQPINET